MFSIVAYARTVIDSWSKANIACGNQLVLFETIWTADRIEYMHSMMIETYHKWFQ